ncbi:MAG TPA: WD40 repeat domain-containing serine/threonine protein kinase [Thermoanaerobaculia bacterium]|nr:WD40 repeat domain-containing serine/threonine protein kinase [Thermoanaerobaculia bacterium]
MPLGVGTRLGPYEILAPLGAGGMGEVYRARDTRLGREVALKVLPEALSSDSGRLRRFEKEARSASSLNHPNIVTVHDFGESNGATFLAMELVEGSTLRELLVEGPLPIKKLLAIGAQVADGLSKAHEAGIVHRDLKPENVMVTKDGHVKILDFGLAKLTQREDTSGATQAPTVSGGTEPGIVVGTVAYMSPEQALGKALDFRSDQFSFGSMLYEMATGKRAFARPSGPETMTAIIREEPEPVGKLAPKIGTPLQWTIERCLAKDREERYGSTRDLARDLQRLRDHTSEPAAAAVAPRRARLPGVVAALLAGLAIGSAAVVFLRRPPADHPVFKRLTFRRGTLWGAGFAPDGHIVYAAAWDGAKTRLYDLAPDALVPRPLDIEASALLSVSRNGELAILRGGSPSPQGYVAGAMLARVPMAGGAPRELAPDVLQAAWAPDGSSLAVLRFADGRARLEYPLGHPSSFGFLAWPAGAPEGHLIAVTRPSEDSDAWDVGVVDERGNYRRISPGWGDITGLAWRPDGGEIWLSGRSKEPPDSGIFSVDLSGHRRRRLSLPGGEYFLKAIGRDGALLLERGDEAVQIQLLSADSSEPRDIATVPGAGLMQISADGRRLLLGVSERSEVYVQGTDGSPPVLIGKSSGDAALSPDDKWVATVKDDDSGLLLLPTGAGEARDVKIQGHQLGGQLTFHPDGRRLVCGGRDGGDGPYLLEIDLDSRKVKKLTPKGYGGGEGTRFVSPDGRQLAFFVQGKSRSFLVPMSGGEPAPIPGCEVNDIVTGWAADSRHVYVFHFGEAPGRVDLVDTQTGDRAHFRDLPITDSTGAIGFAGVRPTPDGSRIGFLIVRRLSALYLVRGLN